MTDNEDFKTAVQEMRGELRAMAASIHELTIASRLGEERQGETTKKLDLLTLTMSNNYVGGGEFGNFKKDIETRVDKLENWLVWILRLTLGAALASAIAALRIKGLL